MKNEGITKELLEEILGYKVDSFVIVPEGVLVYGRFQSVAEHINIKVNLPKRTNNELNNSMKTVDSKATVWSVVRDYINSLPVWSPVTRQELLKEVDKGVERYSPATVDHYRRMLTVVGYLTYDLKNKPPREGHYTVVTHIDERMTSSSLRKQYDTGDF